MPKIAFIFLLVGSFFPTKEFSSDNEYLRLETVTTEVNFAALTAAMKGYEMLLADGKLSNDSVLTVIDFSKSSDQERILIMNPKNLEILFSGLVAHGIESGELMATKFSNQPRSHKSSLGLYITGETYRGKHGYSMRLHGQEQGINGNAFQRAIVMHGAPYVSHDFITKHGRLGRSFGCPALEQKHTKWVVNKIKSGTCLYIYAPDQKYFEISELICDIN